MASTSSNEPSTLDDARREQLKNIEINRIKAKARIRAQAEAEAEASAQSSNNTNGKRPLRVTEGDSASPTKQAKAQDANAPLKRDTRLMGAFYKNSSR